jgi:hypothetical protein
MRMNRRTWVYICLIVLMLVLLGLSFFFSNITVFNWYQHHIYLPYQQLRSLIFNYIPFSIGDILYIILFLALIWAVARLVKRIVRVRSNPQALKLILGRFVLSLTGFYILYFFSWGANYSRPKIWQPKVDTVWNQERLLALNLMLVKELNEEIVQQKERSAAELNSLLYAQYQDFLGQDITVVKAKASIFGDAINYLGIQGYFNPITGEAQLTFGLPRQMWPFVMAHEMAHQVGIAAEGEANFMAYAICVKSADANIIYSGHFNLFLYANRELARTDSLLAHGLYLQLNDKTKDEIKELKEKRAQYKSVFRGTALDIYDWMLQSQGQRKGIRSYGEISRLVYLWELEGAPKLKLNK